MEVTSKKNFSGSVTSMKFTNPHGSLALAARNRDGSSAKWLSALGSATALARRGTASPQSLLKTVTIPDGRVIRISAGKPND